MEDKIVTLEAFYDPMLAEIIRARLEANGISCFIADNNIIGANPLYNQAVGGIKIKVFEHDLEKCRDILSQSEELQLTDDESETTCPYCHSSNVQQGVAKAWHCFNCDKDFE